MAAAVATANIENVEYPPKQKRKKTSESGGGSYFHIVCASNQYLDTLFYDFLGYKKN